MREHHIVMPGLLLEIWHLFLQPFCCHDLGKYVVLKQHVYCMFSNTLESSTESVLWVHLNVVGNAEHKQLLMELLAYRFCK